MKFFTYFRFFKKGFRINTQSQVFSLAKNTKKAVTVLQDLFGNNQPLETEDGLLISPKKKLYCVLLSIFFGLPGFHRLYLGDFLHFLLHIFLICFTSGAYYWLPDNGVALLSVSTLILWTIADILAIMFNRISDSKNRVLVNWL